MNDKLSNLSKENRIKYNNNRLSIIIGSDTQTSGQAVDLANNGYTTIQATSISRENWKAFLGNKSISKIEFYNIAGYPDEVNKYQEILDKNKEKLDKRPMIILLGVLLIVFSFILVATTGSAFSFVLIIIGFLLAYIGSIKPVIDDSAFPSSFAANIADEYNLRLLENLLLKQNFPDEYCEFEESLYPVGPIVQKQKEEKEIKEKHTCSKCGNMIEEKEYYCSKCEKYFCYDCILFGLKCPECKSKINQ